MDDLLAARFVIIRIKKTFKAIKLIRDYHRQKAMKYRVQREGTRQAHFMPLTCNVDFAPFST